MLKKTNAARILDGLQVPYALQGYEVDERDLSAVHVAEVLGIPVEVIFKTLVMRGDGKAVLVAVIPGGDEVDLKKVARISGYKHCEMVAVKEIQQLTGYIRGGCSPVGMKKLYPTFVDAQVLQQDVVLVSAGLRGLQLKLKPTDLIRVCGAVVADLVKGV